MIINNNNYDIDNLVNNIDFEQNFIKKRRNNLYLTDRQIEILKKFDINYEIYNNLDALIFDIEQILNTIYDDSLVELEQISYELAEFNYYNNTIK